MNARHHTARACRLAAALAAALALQGLTGCESDTAAQGQVLARVNADEISVHQLSLAVAQTPRNVTRETASRAALEKLIDRQLAVQQSLRMGLDRRPDVMLRLEEARRDILAAAYASEVSVNTPAVDDEAAARYYAEHPGLFAQRRIYRLREISIPAGRLAATEIHAHLASREALPQLIARLRRDEIGFTDQVSLRPAEQLPIEAADRLSALRAGDMIAVELPRAILVYEMQSAEAAPLPWSAALPIIKAHLTKQQGSAALDSELKRLRASARIRRSDAGLQIPSPVAPG